MSKNKRYLAAFVLLGGTLLAPQAWSQEQGFYLGASLGRSEGDNVCSDLSSVGFTGSCDDKDTSWSLYGGYRFNANLAVEVGYIDFGRFDANGRLSGANATARGDAKAWELSAVGTVPLGKTFALYGKLGLARWDVDSSATVTFGGQRAVGTAGATGTDLTFGIGVTANLARNISARAGFQRFNDVGDSNTTGTTNLDVWSIGLQFRF